MGCVDWVASLADDYRLNGAFLSFMNTGELEDLHTEILECGYPEKVLEHVGEALDLRNYRGAALAA